MSSIAYLTHSLSIILTQYHYFCNISISSIYPFLLFFLLPWLRTSPFLSLFLTAAFRLRGRRA